MTIPNQNQNSTLAMQKQVSRRGFLKTSALAAGGVWLAPRFAIGNPGADANGKLNIAQVGCGSRGFADVKAMRAENIVALCDVDQTVLDRCLPTFPGARTFQDFRKMFDEMGSEIDAVSISTPDHTHFAVAYVALQLGKPIFVQKPLTHDLWELRTLCDLAKERGVVTCMGNQGRASEGIRRIKEWYDADLFGEVTDIFMGTNRPAGGFGFPGGEMQTQKPAGEPVPEGLDWDLWLGPAPETPFNRAFHPSKWRPWWDFGCGALGDIGCHTMDAPYYALDLGRPERVEVKLTGDPNPLYTRSGSVVTYHFPKRGKRPPVRMTWWEGPSTPPIWNEYLETNNLDPNTSFKQGGMFMVGSKQTLWSPGMRPDSPRVMDQEAWADIRRALPEKTIPRVKMSIQREWIHAVKGIGPKPGSHFDYAEGLTENVLLGALAIRSGRDIEWNSKKLEITNHKDLADYVKAPRRKGWEV